jgi:hypothetical protein
MLGFKPRLRRICYMEAHVTHSVTLDLVRSRAVPTAVPDGTYDLATAMANVIGHSQCFDQVLPRIGRELTGGGIVQGPHSARSHCHVHLHVHVGH